MKYNVLKILGPNIVRFVIAALQNSITTVRGWETVLEPTTIGTLWGTCFP